MNIHTLLRKNIAALTPYSSARSEYTGNSAVFLDANENPYNTPYNRYPDPLQKRLKERLSEIKSVPADHIFTGNGSDEAIDLLIRAFCEPAVDNIISIEPSYGMYAVAADTNNVELRRIPLKPNFQINVTAMMEATDANTKLMFLCSPNNPTANCLHHADMEALLQQFKGIVVVDEAYIDFAPEQSLLPQLATYGNLVVLQTLSKAWGMAGIRLGLAFASPAIIKVLNNIKYPYNVNQLTQRVALNLLADEDKKQLWVKILLSERERLTKALGKFSFTEHVFPSDANFLLARVKKPNDIYNYLTECKIIVRNRSKVPLCEGSLRFTVGTPAENDALLAALQRYEKGEPANQSVLSVVERQASVQRTTKETDINIVLDLDGTGKSDITTGIGFFDHMLDQLARHSGCNLTIKVKGDLHIDEHHTIEDTAIALGTAFAQALGSKRGIERYGFCLPMDDCLARVALDFGGRSWLVWKVRFKRNKIGEMPTEMFYHFFKSFSDAAQCNLNIKAKGKNEHHKIEAIFKALAKAIRMAVRQDFSNFSLPSTKGKL